MKLPRLIQRKEPLVGMTRPPLPQRVSQSPVTSGIHLAEAVHQKYRVLGERLRPFLSDAERTSLDLELTLVHMEVTDAVRAIGRETYGGGDTR